MKILKVNNDSFEKEVLQSSQKVLVDFYADWCGPCKMLSPIINEVSEEYKGAKFVKLNIDEEQYLAIKYNVMSIPTLLVFNNGKEIKRSVGLISKAEILDLLK